MTLNDVTEIHENQVIQNLFNGNKQSVCIGLRFHMSVKFTSNNGNYLNSGDTLLCLILVSCQVKVKSCNITGSLNAGVDNRITHPSN
jgi:hypothetical protein